MEKNAEKQGVRAGAAPARTPCFSVILFKCLNSYINLRNI